MAEYAAGHNPNSRANLIPFVAGDDARRKPGSPNAGRAVTAYFNELCTVDDDDTAKYDLMELRSIAADPAAPHPKAIAATLLLAAREKGYDKVDRQPKSLAAIREILDRLLGKPRVQVDVTHRSDVRPPLDIVAEIVGLLPENLTNDQWRSLLNAGVRRRPELADLFRQVADTAPVDAEVLIGDVPPDGNQMIVKDLKRQAEP